MEILILTGTCGVGKTTIATAWAKQNNGAIVDCDYFTEWIFNKEFKHHTPQEEVFVAGLAAKVALEYIHLHMSVAIDNVWTPLGIEILIKELKARDPQLPIKVVWLYCQPAINHSRDAMRILENQMKDRLDVVYQELIQYDWPAYIQKIDTSDFSILQTIAHIDKLAYLNI